VALELEAEVGREGRLVVDRPPRKSIEIDSNGPIRTRSGMYLPTFQFVGFDML
jgi:hypothetical protein